MADTVEQTNFKTAVIEWLGGRSLEGFPWALIQIA